MQLMGSYDNQQYLYLCREDKKCNVFLLPLYKHFHVIRAEWSSLHPFSTYHKGYIAPGQAITEVTISSPMGYRFTLSTLLPELNRYVPGFPAFSLRAGRYEATVSCKIAEPLNAINGEGFLTTYDETFSFFVPEYGNVVLTLFASVGATYKEYKHYKDDRFGGYEIRRDPVAHKFAHTCAVLSGEEARTYYKWWDLESNLLKTVPYGNPYPSPGTVSTPKPTATASPKPTTPTKSVSTPKPVARTTATKSVATPKPAARTTATKSVAAPKPAARTTATKPVAAPKPAARPTPKPTSTTTYSKPTPPKTPIARPQPTPTKKLELQKREYPKMELKKQEYPKMELKKREYPKMELKKRF